MTNRYVVTEEQKERSRAIIDAAAKDWAPLVVKAPSDGLKLLAILGMFGDAMGRVMRDQTINPTIKDVTPQVAE